MARRRSRNRRLSSLKSNNSNLLNDNTTFYDEDDPLWFDRSIVRPSTSFNITRRSNVFLNSDSSVNTSKLSSNWYNELTRSDSSKLIEQVAKINSNDQKNTEDNENALSSTDTETIRLSQKKRAKLKGISKKINETNKTNFLKVLEKTNDSHLKNSTNIQVSEGNETDSTVDESKTFKKIRPQIFKKSKLKDNTSHFDVFTSDSASEHQGNISRTTRQSLKRKSSSLNYEDSIPIQAQKVSKRLSENLTNVLSDVHENENSFDKTKNSSISGSLQNKNDIPKSDSKSSTSKKNPNVINNTTQEFANISKSSSIVENVKKRPALFSQEQKSINNKNNFEDVFDFAGESENESKNEENDNRQSANDSESSSIPTNIRRTRSLSMFQQRKSTSVSDDEIPGTQYQQVNNGNNVQDQLIVEKTKSLFTSSEETSDEDIYDGSKNNTKNSSKTIENEKSYHQLSKENLSTTEIEENVNLSKSKITNKSMSLQYKSKEKSQDNVSNISFNKDTLISEASKEISNKIQDNQSLKNRSNQSHNESSSAKSLNKSANKSHTQASINADIVRFSSERKEKPANKESLVLEIFDLKNSSSKEKSMTTQIVVHSQSKDIKDTENLNTPTTFINNIGRNTVNNLTNEESIFPDNITQTDDYESESSSIPKNIRRTKSRLFNELRPSDNDKTHNNTNLHKSSQEDANEKSRTNDSVTQNSKNQSNTVNADVSYNSSDHQLQSEAQVILEDIMPNSISYDSSCDSRKENRASINLQDTRKSTTFNSSNNTRNKAKTNVSTRASSKLDISTRSHTTNRSANRKRNSTKTYISNKTRGSLVEMSDKLKTPNISSKEKDISYVSNGNRSRAKSKEILNDVTAKAKANTMSFQMDSLEDIIQLRKPAQSTPIPNAKLFTRLTRFSLKESTIINENEANSLLNTRDIEAENEKEVQSNTANLEDNKENDEESVSNTATGEEDNNKEDKENDEEDSESNNIDVEEEKEDSRNRKNFQSLNAEQEKEGNNSDEDIVVDVCNNSDVSESPLLIRKIADIPEESASHTSNKITSEDQNFLSSSKDFRNDSSKSNLNSKEINWSEIDKRIKTMIAKTEAREKREEERKHEYKCKQAKVDAELKKLMKKQELDKKNRKPVHKAYYINGHVYKQPKLPYPQRWVTDRLYKYLWKCMEPKFGDNTRIKSEKLVTRMSRLTTIIRKRTLYRNYKAELDELMFILAEHNIIETQFDFQRFCSEFLPRDIRLKVVPMLLPGNVENIPYEPELLYKPILRKTSEKSRAPI